MKNLLIGTILALSTITIASCEATVESWDPTTGIYTLSPSGNVK